MWLQAVLLCVGFGLAVTVPAQAFDTTMQNLLKQVAGVASERGIYFIQDSTAWQDISPGEQAKIKEAFFRAIEPGVDQVSYKTGIEPLLLYTMAAKESRYGTNRLTQLANNPMSLKKAGKENFIHFPYFSAKDYRLQTITQWDHNNTYEFIKFENLADCVEAFAWNLARWAYLDSQGTGAGFGTHESYWLCNVYKGISMAEGQCYFTKDRIVRALAFGSYFQKDGSREVFARWFNEVNQFLQQMGIDASKSDCTTVDREEPWCKITELP